VLRVLSMSCRKEDAVEEGINHPNQEDQLNFFSRSIPSRSRLICSRLPSDREQSRGRLGGGVIAQSL
jgi:hypothetical protein